MLTLESIRLTRALSKLGKQVPSLGNVVSPLFTTVNRSPSVPVVAVDVQPYEAVDVCRMDRRCAYVVLIVAHEVYRPLVRLGVTAMRVLCSPALLFPGHEERHNRNSAGRVSSMSRLTSSVVRHELEQVQCACWRCDTL